MTDTVRFRVEGSLPSMKNSRRIVTNLATGKPMVIKSRKAELYARYFALQVPARYKGRNLTGDLRLTLRVVYSSKLSDLDGEYMCDLLQAVGVIENDRQIKEKHFYHLGVNRKNPYTEVELEVLEDVS